MAVSQWPEFTELQQAKSGVNLDVEKYEDEDEDGNVCCIRGKWVIWTMAEKEKKSVSRKSH